MSDELKLFFTAITNDKEIQKQLFISDKLSDVAAVANKLGFNVKGAEILQSQAGRVLAILDEQSDDVTHLVSGIKPKTGAQWGRGGGGFLDSVGYWINKLSSPTFITDTEEQINKFLDRARQEPILLNKLLKTKTFNEAALLIKANGFNVSAVKLLSHQAQKILALNEDDANTVADN